ncbi:F-box/kelch-repeat protein At3g17530-like [Neltuma alba]|uniref:F-box/kelch-repeat protein At3g17530-like n=1 Tax=Neltuma alba TaxID=207710 RepID=UPI0010A2D406|nr:F-box/kelch-repeat protein At3g17530-like [Prosopis alba]
MEIHINLARPKDPIDLSSARFPTTTKQRLMDGETPYFPEEIIRGILIRLPVKSLIRFQCVSKKWKNLIKRPSFVDDHLRRSAHQYPSLLLWRQHGTSRPWQLRLMDSEMHVRELQIPPSLRDSKLNVKIVGSCNGLVCAEIKQYYNRSASRNFRKSILLWNPATGEVKQIPRTRTYETTEWDCIGFGFSPIVNDYKIVQIHVTIHYGSPIEVYSLSTDSWKEIGTENLKGVRPNGEWVTVNGRMFWRTLRGKVGGKEQGYFILSFDIATEVFTAIPWPPQVSCRGSYCALSVHNNKLAIIRVPTIGHLHSWIDLWVLEEEDGISSSTGRWSWTGKFPSDLCSGTTRFLMTIWRNNFVFFSDEKPIPTNGSGSEMENDKQRVCQSFTEIISINEGRISIIPGFYDDVFNHVESLVPIGNIHLEEPLF